jgi:hypothetical protein
MKVTINTTGLDRLFKDVTANIERDARQKIAGMRCPEHGETPRVVSEGRSGFKIAACCEEHAKRALNRLK